MREIGACSWIAARTALTVETLATIAAVATFRPLRALVGRSLLAGLDQLFLALIAFEFFVALAARVLLFEASAILAQDAEIMVRELEIIFGLDTIAGELRIARHALVLFEQLGGIAALAIILAVARLSTEVPASLPSTTAPAAALTIIDQMPTSLRSSLQPLRLSRAGRRRA